MSANPAPSASMATVAPADPVTFGQLGWCALLGVELLAVGGAVGLMLVLAQQSPEAVRDAWRYFDVGWILIAGLGALSGCVAAGLARRAVAASQAVVAMACLALALMAGCATLAAGAIETVSLWRYPQPMRAPHVVRVGSAAPPVQASPVAPTATASGGEPDLANGRTLYGTSCAACHGGAGEGVEGIGLALAGNPGLDTHTDQQLVDFLKMGRAPDAPDSKMGRAMPARGGNLALTDADLADITAFLRTLEAVSGEESTGPIAAAPPRWLLSPPTAPVAAGLAAAHRTPQWPHAIDGLARPLFHAADRDLTVRCLATIVTVQGFHMVALVTLMTLALIRPSLVGAPPPALGGVRTGWFILLGMQLAYLAAWTALA